MNIRFDHIVPAFLEGLNQPSGDVWGNDFTLEKGKHYLLQAGSGRGKSTALGIIFGTRTGYKGNAFLGNDNAQKLSNAHWSRLRAAHLSMVFQELRLFDQLTVQENLLLKSRISPKTSLPQATEWLKQLGVGDFLQRPCKTLSFGQQQRVAIVRALLQDFEWLLMDEPFSHLDDANRDIALQLCKARCEEQGAGMLLTSLGSDYNISYERILRL